MINTERFCDPKSTLFEPIPGRFEEDLPAERFNSTL
jgi:hypothetical protein